VTTIKKGIATALEEVNETPKSRMRFDLRCYFNWAKKDLLKMK